MNGEKEEIIFTINYNQENHVVKTFPNEYRNLMFLLKDKVCPEDFGECGGMGRCGTCLIRTSGSSDNLNSTYRNEQSTLSKMGITNQAIRLSCQIQIDDNLNDLLIEVLNDECCC